MGPRAPAYAEAGRPWDDNRGIGEDPGTLSVIVTSRFSLDRFRPSPDRRDLRGQNAAVAVRQRDLGVLDLAVAAIATCLANALDHHEQAVHARMDAR